MATTANWITERPIDLREICGAIGAGSPLPMAAVAGIRNIIQYVNPAFCVLAAESEEDLIGRPFSEAIPAGQVCLALLARVYGTARAESFFENGRSTNELYWSYAMWPAIASDGENVGIIIQVTESAAAHEHTVAINQALIIASLRQHELAEQAEGLNVLLLAEIEDRKLAEHELLRAKSDLEELTFSMTHDLQEPLRTLIVYTQLLARQLGRKIDADQRLSIKQILFGSRRMGELIKDLLAYLTMGAAGNQDKVQLSCGLAVQDVLLNLKGSIEESGAVITLVEPMPTVNGNLLQLGQLFQNLIGNALKYRKVDTVPEVRISADFREGCWLFSVRDNGIGFKPEYAKQIFGVFKRLHDIECPGTGIGLAICKRIVESHGGRIWATGEEGIGSIFHFTLPDAIVALPSR